MDSGQPCNSRARQWLRCQSNTRRTAGSVHGRKTHGLLIAGQIALTLLLLAGAGTAMEGFQRLMHLPLGYDPHNVMAVSIPAPDNAYKTWEARSTYLEQLRTAVSATPGVTIAGIALNATPPRNGSDERFEIEGRAAPDQQDTLVNFVGPGYFPALRIPLLRGRLWTEAENHAATHIVVINQAMARIYFPNGDAIGQSIKVPRIENRPPIILAAPGIAHSWLQIVGIVADHRNDGLRVPARPEAFVPWTFCMRMYTRILVRSDAPPASLLHSIRKQLATVNADQQTGREADDLEQWLKDEPEWQQTYLIAWIFGAFSVLALALAAMGLYSVVSYSVTQRTSEFGIRMALGAQRSHVLRIVFASVLVNVGAGILSGIVLRLALNRVLATWSEGGSPYPPILITAIFLLVLVAAVACTVPARRASKLDPMTALRCE